MKHLLVVLIFSLFISNQLLSQITVDNSVTPEVAMQTLLGENVTISNLQFTGFNEQIGTFSCEECGLDFDEGVILASGDVDTALGPNQSGSLTIGGVFSPGSDPDLDILNTTSAGDFNDIAVLEFDFVALGDSVWFDYVFASDEYPEFSGSGFNDTFGFFMSGPGITGPYSNDSENLAIIPGTTTGVTINNVNAGTAGTAVPGDADCNNCEYYENNGTGQPGQPQFDDPNVVGYDGYTVGLRAIKGGLICGETYHLRLVIADAGDNAYDSAVILRAGSLSSNLVVQVELEIEATTEDGVMNEECGVATLNFIRPEAIDSALEFIVEVEYAGDALNGVDYTLLPDVIVFDPGVDTITYIMDAFEDGVVEGLESVQFIMENLAVCEGEAVPSFFEFFITESQPLNVTGYDVQICQGSTVEIQPIVEGGSGGFLYEWSTTETTPSISVTPDVLTTYSVELSDTCLASVGFADINVDIAVYPELELTVTPASIDIDCDWFGENLTMQAVGGDGTYSYEWLGEGGTTIAFGNNTWIWDNNITELTAQVTDGCTFQTQVEIPITNDVPLLEVDVPNEITICPGEFTIEPVVTGGDGTLNYNWSNGAPPWDFFGTDPTLTTTTDDDLIINFSVSDFCGQFIFETINVTVAAPVPLEIEAGSDQEAGCEDLVHLAALVISGVEPYEFDWTTEDSDDLGNNQDTSFNLEETETVILTVSDACNQEMTDTLDVELILVPLEIDVPEILIGDCLTQFEIEAEVNLADDNISFTWNGPAGMNVIGNNQVNYQSLNSGIIEVTGEAGCQNIATGSTEIVVESPPIELSLVPDTSICVSGTAVLSASAIGGSGELTYQWIEENVYEQFTTVSPSFTSSYELEVTDECTNQTSDFVTVEVQHVSVSYETVSEDLYSYLFIPTVVPECDDCTFYWNFSDGQDSFLDSPYHEFSQTGYIGASVVVTTSSGCQADYNGLVNVPPIIYVPNSFTPDNDGVNDVFAVSSTGIDEYELVIFNRWGEVVFQSKDPTEAWVGDFNKGDYYVPEGIYTYVLKYRSLDTQAKILNGSVTVIR